MSAWSRERSRLRRGPAHPCKLVCWSFPPGLLRCEHCTPQAGLTPVPQLRTVSGSLCDGHRVVTIYTEPPKLTSSLGSSFIYCVPGWLLLHEVLKAFFPPLLELFLRAEPLAQILAVGSLETGKYLDFQGRQQATITASVCWEVRMVLTSTLRAPGLRRLLLDPMLAEL